MTGASHDVIERHLKKVVPLAHSKARLELAVSQELFSSAAIDAGTALLLRLLAEQPRIRDLSRVLDVGCGYGPIGLLLAAWNPSAVVHCVDRDALAVAFTAHNAERNGLESVSAYPSLGYDDVSERQFDLITSNIPAKAGPAVIAGLVTDARHLLAPGGTAAVVGIDRIVPVIRDALTSPDFEVVATRSGRGYSCFVYRATAPSTAPILPAFQRGDYDRPAVSVQLDGRRLQLTPVFGLPEFDTIGHPTALAAGLLGERDLRRPAVYAPAQGHLPLLLAERGAQAVTLLDRDLLALRATERVLLPTGLAVRAVLAADPVADAATGCDSAVVVLREPQAQRTHVQAVRALRESIDGPIIVTGPSTAVTRALDGAGLQSLVRRRRAGSSAALALVRRPAD